MTPRCRLCVFPGNCSTEGGLLPSAASGGILEGVEGEELACAIGHLPRKKHVMLTTSPCTSIYGRNSYLGSNSTLPWHVRFRGGFVRNQSAFLKQKPS